MNNSLANCYSQEVIDEYLSGKILKVNYVNQLFNFKGYGDSVEDFVKPYLDETLFIDLATSNLQSYPRANLKIMKSKMDLRDDYFMYWHLKEHEYVEVSGKEIVTEY